MYSFCLRRGLREVWGYMWANWYSPQRWPLWARSTCPRLTRLRTTMTVENFWRQLKHNDLHHLVHPRIDQLVYILIHNVTPAYYRRMQTMSADFRLGRSTKLTTHQRYFKSEWRRLEKATVSGKTYETNVAQWICNCGRQKYSAYHICKHLVQAVNPPPISFWNHVHRRRTSPLYRHPALVPREAALAPTSYMDPDLGSITDGDDNLWSGNPSDLEDGSWRTGRLATSLPRNERAADVPAPTAGETSERPTGLSGTAASLASGSVPSPDDTSQPRAQDLRGDVSEDEDDIVDTNLAWLRVRIATHEAGLELLKKQLVLPSQDSKLFIARLKAQDFGRDMVDLTQDMLHVESTGRKRSTTWARPSDAPRKRRRLNNTLGYHRTSSSCAASSARESSPAAPSIPDLQVAGSDAEDC
ncbi:hypothetical protein K523DRAFT_315006 [Schizophyllum commune Tattone D]|nr:hypothetical protein K523DRAFT_315006 [Schizophyllum commune Tattone D]